MSKWSLEFLVFDENIIFNPDIFSKNSYDTQSTSIFDPIFLWL